MTEQEARIIAIPVMQNIVNCLADHDYERIPEYAAFPEGITVSQLRNWCEAYLKQQNLRSFDHYGVAVNAQAYSGSTPFEQLNVYIYNDGSGFTAEYDLASGGVLDDLILMIEFLYDENMELIPYLENLHVLQ